MPPAAAAAAAAAKPLPPSPSPVNIGVLKTTNRSVIGGAWFWVKQ